MFQSLKREFGHLAVDSSLCKCISVLSFQSLKREFGHLANRLLHGSSTLPVSVSIPQAGIRPFSRYRNCTDMDYHSISFQSLKREFGHLAMYSDRYDTVINVQHVSIPQAGIRPFSPAAICRCITTPLSFQSLKREFGHLADSSTCDLIAVRTVFQSLKREFGHLAVDDTCATSKVLVVSIPQAGIRPFSRSYSALKRQLLTSAFNPSSGNSAI